MTTDERTYIPLNLPSSASHKERKGFRDLCDLLSRSHLDPSLTMEHTPWLVAAGLTDPRCGPVGGGGDRGQAPGSCPRRLGGTTSIVPSRTLRTEARAWCSVTDMHRYRHRAGLTAGYDGMREGGDLDMATSEGTALAASKTSDGGEREAAGWLSPVCR